MGLGATLVLLAIAFVVQKLLAPKPDPVDNTDKYGITRPTMEEGIVVPLVYGRVLHRGPNVFFLPDFYTIAVNQPPSSGPFGGSELIEIARANVIMGAFGICLGFETEVIKIHDVFVNDKNITSRDLNVITGSFPLTTDGQTAQYRLLNATGGAGKGGGVDATIIFHPGTFLQDTDDLMDGPFQTLNFNSPADYVDSLPAYRGLCYVATRGIYGEGGALPDVGFDLEAIPGLFDLTGITMPQIVLDDVQEANPASVLWDLLTSGWRGLGVASDEVDFDNFYAVAEVLEDEQQGMSIIVAQETQAISLIQDILRQIDGVMYFDHDAGKIKLKLIRNDYTVGALPSLDVTNVDTESKPVLKTTVPDEVFNQVRVLFEDRDKNYTERPAVAVNDAAITAQGGRIRTSDQRFPGVKNATLANKLAFRELKFLSTPTAQLTVKVNRESVDLQPGDPFKFTWPDYGVADMVFRVQAIDRGTLDDGRITIHAIRDKFDTSGRQIFPAPGHGASGPVSGPDFGVVEPVDPDASRGFEAPRWVLAQAVTWGHTNTNNEYDSFTMILASRPLSSTAQRLASYHSETSITAQDSYQRETPPTREIPVVPFARTAQALHWEDYDVVPSLVIEGLTDTSVLNNLTGGSEDEEIAIGTNLIMFTDPTGRSGHTSSFAQFHESLGYGVDEICAYEAYNDLGDGRVELINVRRGLLDTVSNDLRYGSQAWFLDQPDSLAPLGRNRYNGDEDLDYRVIPGSGITDGNPDDQDDVLMPLSHRALGWYPTARFYLKGNNTTFGWVDYGTFKALEGALVDVPEPITSHFVRFGWTRRDRDNSTIIDNSEADEPLNSGDCSYYIEHRPAYLVLSPHEAQGSWSGPGAVSATSGFDDFSDGLLFWGPTYFRVRAVRNADNDGRTDVGDVAPLQSNYILANVRSFRQLLSNPYLIGGTSSWTTETGTPSITAGSYSDDHAMGEFSGARRFGSSTGDTRLSQTTPDLSTMDIVGQDALLVYYVRVNTGGE